MQKKHEKIQGNKTQNKQPVHDYILRFPIE